MLRWISTALAACMLAAISLSAQQMPPTPARQSGEGEGPFDRMVIRGITVIDGTGAPPRGPIDIVVQNNRIAEVSSVGFPGIPIPERGRPAKGTKEIDGTGIIYAGMNDLLVVRKDIDAMRARYADALQTPQQTGAGVLTFTAADRGTPLVLADGRGEVAREFARIAVAVRRWLARPAVG